MTDKEILKKYGYGCKVGIVSPKMATGGKGINSFKFLVDLAYGQRIRLKGADSMLYVAGHQTDIIRMFMAYPNAQLVNEDTQTADGLWIKVAQIMKEQSIAEIIGDSIRQGALGVAANANALVDAVSTAYDGLSMLASQIGNRADVTKPSKLARVVDHALKPKVLVQITPLMPPPRGRFHNPQGKLPGNSVTFTTLAAACQNLMKSL